MAFWRKRHHGPPLNLGEALNQAQQSAAEWNRHFPVGTAVRVYEVLGEEDRAWESVTRSQAGVIGDHSAVVWVEGKPGCYALTHVRPLPGRAAVPSERFFAPERGVSRGVFELASAVAAAVTGKEGA